MALPAEEQHEPITAQLRERTRPQHDALDSHPSLGMLGESITPDSYAWILKKFLGFHRPMEASLARAADWDAMGLHLGERRKAPMAAADLRDLGHEPDAAPDCADLPPHDTIPAAIGCIYVLEGSTLGGQYIAKGLRKNLPPELQEATRYFSSYGDKTGSMWKQFKAFADETITEERDREECLEAAAESFDAMARWLSS